jgi:NTP pyrophosphatase (non-canonical NTP hydrolase)
MSNLTDLQKRAVDIRHKYDKMAAKQGRAPWGSKERAMGFVTDMGELMELIMAKENLRDVEDVDAKLAHELADCLWSILNIADYYNVDLEKAFATTMKELDERIARAMHEN